MSADIRLPRIAQRPEDFTLWSACFDGDEGRVEDCIAENPASIFDADNAGNTALHYSLARSSLRTATAVLLVPLEEQYVIYKDKLSELAKRAQKMGRSMVSEEDLQLCEQWLNEERSRYGSEFQVQCCQISFDLLSMENAQGLTPLHYAATTRDNTLASISELWTKFADSKVMYRSGARAFGAGSGSSGRDTATARLRQHEVTVVKRRAKKIALQNVNAKDKQGNTPLHFAAASGSNDALRRLISLGADKNTRNKNAQTPTEVAKDRFCRMALLQMPEAADRTIDELGPSTGRKKTSGAGDDDNDMESKEQEEDIGAGQATPLGKQGAMQVLLSRGEDVNEVSSIQSNTALHRAAIRGQVDVTASLLKAGADVEKTNCNGWTPLHCCAYSSTYQHRAVATMLLDADVNVNALTLRKRSALHIAVLQMNVDSSTPKSLSSRKREGVGDKTLKQSSSKWLSSGWGSFDENTRSNLRSPQRKIRQSKSVSDAVVSMIDLLIQRGIKIDGKDGDGKTALHHAAEGGNPRTVARLIEAGADIYATCRRDYTALHYASSAGKDDVVRLLVKLDCEDRKLKSMTNRAHQKPFDVASNKKTREAMNNLWESCEDGQLERVRAYLNNVPSISATDSNSATTGEEALQALRPWLPVTVTEKTRKSQRSCLHLVCRGSGQARLRESKKFKDKRRHDRGVSSKSFSKSLKQEMARFDLLVQLLLSKGAEADQRDAYGATPLMYAAQGGSCSIIQILLRDGHSDFDLKDQYGNTALHYAIAYGQVAAANLLETNGADALALNDCDETPTDVAGLRNDLLPYLNKKARERYKNRRERREGGSSKKRRNRRSNDEDNSSDSEYDDDDFSDDAASAAEKHKRASKILENAADDVDAEKSKKSKKTNLKEIAQEVAADDLDAEKSKKSKKASLKEIAQEVDAEERETEEDRREQPEEKPVAQRPSAARPTGPRPSEARPSGARPSGARPSGARPSGARPSGARPSGARPSGARPPPRS